MPRRPKIQTPSPQNKVQTVLPSTQVTYERIEELALTDGEISPSDRVNAIDIAEYCDRVVTGGIRSACLALDVALRSGTGISQEVRNLLLERWERQTVYDMFNTAKNVIPLLRRHGLLSYKDPHNLRNVMRGLKASHHPMHSALLQGIKDGLSDAALRRIYKALPPNGRGNADDSETSLTNSIQGREFEDFIATLLPRLYSGYHWTYSGGDKQSEEGFDFLGTNDVAFPVERIGVQVKRHDKGTSPSRDEWQCFASALLFRRCIAGVFITTGKLNREQRVQAEKSGIIRSIEGISQLNEVCERHNHPTFEEWKKG